MLSDVRRLDPQEMVQNSSVISLIAINLGVSMKFGDLTDRGCNFLIDRLVILALLKEV